jgi:DNA-binding NtrC family response regulator
VIQTLMSLDFPGNVRELENIIERAVIYCRDETLQTRDLCLDDVDKPMFMELDRDHAALSFKDAKDRMTDLFHRQYVESLLQSTNGNVSRAAEKAGIQRQYFHRLMKEAGIEAEGFKHP